MVKDISDAISAFSKFIKESKAVFSVSITLFVIWFIAHNTSYFNENKVISEYIPFVLIISILLAIGWTINLAIYKAASFITGEINKIKPKHLNETELIIITALTLSKNGLALHSDDVKEKAMINSLKSKGLIEVSISNGLPIHSLTDKGVAFTGEYSKALEEIQQKHQERIFTYTTVSNESKKGIGKTRRPNISGPLFKNY